MLITLTWLRLDGLRRWRSLAILALLIALATATVLTSIAGARRGQTAFDRLWASTLPARGDGAAQPARDRLGQGRGAARSHRADQVPGRVRVRGPGLHGGQHRVPAGRRPDDPDHRAARHPGRAAVQPAPPRRGHRHPQVRRDLRQARGRHAHPGVGQPAAGRPEYDGSTGPPLGPKVRARIVGEGRSSGPRRGLTRTARRHPHHARLVHPVSGRHDGHERAGVHQRAGPAQGRRGPRFRPSGPTWGPADRALGHRHLGQLAANRRSRAQGVRVRGRLPAGLRARGAGGRAVPDRPVHRPVRLGHGGGSPGAPGAGDDPGAGRRHHFRRHALAGVAGSTLGVAGAVVASRWMPIGLASSPSRTPVSTRTGSSWAPGGCWCHCWCWPVLRPRRRSRWPQGGGRRRNAGLRSRRHWPR